MSDAARILAEHGLKVSAIGSPIGKVFIDEDFDAHLQRAQHAVEVAHHFGARYVRIFSFFIRPDDHREEVLRRMRALAEVAEGIEYRRARGRPAPAGGPDEANRCRGGVRGRVHRPLRGH
ncbi:sugar phosphate isomerase/epimerase family protein [Pseudactinotalea sp. Z1748]|uniref:sugar phosphate isomerase/epimerase family protein n=1 Tax=Pseudactinotalea sp. Z1748 TaxID=3413027 RepID=UPI003C7EB951